MSLLNDALKDLDRSRQHAASDRAKSAASGAPLGRNAKIKQYALPALAALAALLWLIIEVDILGVMPKEAVVPDPVAPIALNSKWLQVDPQSLQAAQVQPIGVDPVAVSRVTVVDKQGANAAASESVTHGGDAQLLSKHVRPSGDNVSTSREEGTDAVAPTSANAVAQLLDEANDAFQQDRLMTPAGNNAYQLYRSVLIIEPNNLSALAGIISIQQRYLQLAEVAVQARQLSTAELYLQRATKAGASAQQIEPYRLMAAQNNATPVANGSQKMQVKFDKDLDLAQRIREYPLAHYESKAWSRIESKAPSGWTAMALADAYAAKHNHGQLRRLITTVTDGDPAVAAYVQSQWLVLNGDLKGAAQMLEPYVETPDKNLFHLRLLAGIRASLSDYRGALPLYRQLVETSDFSLNDWLGYAVALERVGERSAALHAYQRISRIRHTDRRINDYINGRIRDLSGEY